MAREIAKVVCGGGWRASTTDVLLGTGDVLSDRSYSVRLRDGGALRSLGWQQARAPRRDQRAPVLNMFPHRTSMTVDDRESKYGLTVF